MLAMDRARRPRVVVAKPSKRGCRTCRIRRVKCDETRPNCKRCTSTGRTCDGYHNLLLANSIEATKRSLLPSTLNLSKRNPSLDRQALPSLLSKPTAPPSPRPYGDEYERNSFDYFRLRSAYPIWQISPTREWVQLALKFSTDDATVFKAAAAVGAINEAMVPISHHSLVRPKNAEKETRAVELYCTASAQLRKSINLALAGKAPLGPILLCCILFVCVEMLLERSEVAAAHLQFGRMVVRDVLSAKMNRGDDGPINDPLFTSVMREALLTFSRTVEVEDTGSTDSSHLPDLRAGEAEDNILWAQKLLDEPFASVKSAKTTLRILIRHGSNVRRQLVQVAEDYIALNCKIALDEVSQYCLAQTLSRSIGLSQHIQLQNDLKSSLNFYELWLKRLRDFQQLHQRKSPATRALPLLEIQHFESYFSLSTARQIKEIETDTFSPQFEHILRLSEEYLTSLPSTQTSITHPKAHPISPEEAKNQSSFSLDPGLLPALHLIAIKSRSHRTRQRALDLLLSCNRREGLVWSHTMGHHASKIVQEEKRRGEGLELSASRGKEDSDREGRDEMEMPEAARFSDVVHAGADRVEDACVVAARFMHEYSEGESGVEIVRFRHVRDSLALEEVRKLVFPYRF